MSVTNGQIECLWNGGVVSPLASRTYRLDMLLELVGYGFRIFCVFFGDEG